MNYNELYIETTSVGNTDIDHTDDICCTVYKEPQKRVEIAANLAEARLKDIHGLPFEALVEPDNPADPDGCTHYKEEYQDEFNRYYDEEYNRLASLMKFDYAEKDSIVKE